MKDQGIIAKYLPQEDGCLAFLNTVVGDLDGSKLSVQDLIEDELKSVMSSIIPMPINHLAVTEQDGLLLNYCMALEPRSI